MAPSYFHLNLCFHLNIFPEAEPEQFTVGLLDGPFKVGVPFSIPLEFQDKFRNPTKPPARVKPSIKAE